MKVKKAVSGGGPLVCAWQVSVGEYALRTKHQEPKHGQCLWYENLESAPGDLDFPPDLTQVPDIFVELMDGDSRVPRGRNPPSLLSKTHYRNIIIILFGLLF